MGGFTPRSRRDFLLLPLMVEREVSTDDAGARHGPTSARGGFSRDDILLAALRPLTAGLAALFAVIAITKPLVVSAPALGGVIAWQFLISAASLALYLGLRRDRFPPERAHVIAASIATVVLVDGMIHYVFIANPLETFTFIIVALGLGVFMSAPRWFAAMLGLTFIAWVTGVVLSPAFPPSDWVTHGIFVVEAAVLATLAFIGRVRVLSRLEASIATEAAHHRDLTNALTRIKTSEARFRLLADNAVDVVYRVRLRPERAFEYVSPSVTRMFGLAPEAHYENADIWVETCEPADAAKLMAGLTGRSDRLMEIRWTRPDGERIWTQHRNVAVRDATGRVVAVEGIARDITAMKEIENDLRVERDHLAALTEELSEANEELSTFSYTVSHDLRAPLRGIDYFSRALWDEYAVALPREGVEYLSRVRSEAARLTRLVNELLQLSRVTRADIERGPVDLSALAREVVAGLRAEDPSRDIEVLIEDDATASADADLVRVVLENLFQNAWKFTRDAPDARIEFGSRREDDGETFFVRDNGVGFDMSRAKRLFRPFYRMHSATEFEGTGIGLATVARVVARHDGHVWAESAPGEGATFFFQLERPTLTA